MRPCIALSLITFPLTILSAQAIIPSPPPLPQRVEAALRTLKSTRNAPLLERAASFVMAAKILAPHRLASRIVAAYTAICLAAIAASCAPTATYDL